MKFINIKEHDKTMTKKYKNRKYKLEELVVLERININGLTTFLNIYEKCEVCDIFMKEKHPDGKCNDCPYIHYSTHNNGKHGNEWKMRIGCGPIFGPYLGLTNNNEIAEVGRTRIVYFHRHPELQFRLPKLPKEDFFGNTNCTHWVFHHFDNCSGNLYNDRHVVRVTNREHARFEAMQKRGDYLWLNILLRTRERHPSLDCGKIINSKDMPKYYRSWKKINEKWVLKDGINIIDFYNSIKNVFYEVLKQEKE